MCLLLGTVYQVSNMAHRPLVCLYRDLGSSAIHTDKQVNIDPWIMELYVDLMCQFRPQEVYNYIKLNEGYRLEQTLAVSYLPLSLQQHPAEKKSFRAKSQNFLVI